VLVALADLDYPSGDTGLLPLREQAYPGSFPPTTATPSNASPLPGAPACALPWKATPSTPCSSGLADERVDHLVKRLLAWQWPTGCWNCDKHPKERVSSFTETLIPCASSPFTAG
jgi:hypothetical protein